VLALYLVSHFSIVLSFKCCGTLTEVGYVVCLFSKLLLLDKQCSFFKHFFSISDLMSIFLCGNHMFLVYVGFSFLFIRHRPTGAVSFVLCDFMMDPMPYLACSYN